ncbi:Chromosome partition protein Smc [Stieleria neptunia]|uniref:Chromosome partition protein Smc n=1 Tax=Stieleria neptunia TaxID=2527979 RepID=A0A518HZJ8_9BACT|nr:c-type cytochrome domain-containing protein [Stieleria neptunia]QDV46276.1 Chromosome partition protein Smc [Stieleria neptunia]
MMRDRSLPIVLMLCFLAPTAVAEQTDPNEPLSYARDIAPILQRNCVACHRAKQAEGGLSLETHQAIQAGGDSGSLLVAKQPDSSVLYLRASDDDDPMPPDDNTVGAKRLTAEELALLRTWINQGAILDGQVDDDEIAWQPIPESVRNSYSIAVAPDNRMIAIGHANRVELRDAHSGQHLGNLIDESLPQSGVADFDVVQAIAFSPWADRIATGGYRTVRIWKRQSTEPSVPLALRHASGPTTVSPDRAAVAVVNAIGDVEIRTTASQELRVTLPSLGPVAGIAWSHPEQLVVGYESGDIGIYGAHDGTSIRRMKLDHAIATVAQSSDGNFVASLGTNGQVRLFNGDQPHPSQIVDALNDATSIAFSAPGTLVVGTASGVCKLIDPAADKVVRELAHGSSVPALAIDKAGKTLVTGGSDGIAKRWNTEDGKLLQTFLGDSQSQLRIASLDRDVKREQSWLQTLEGKTKELNQLLEKEEAALAKVTEAREKAVKELDEKAKQRDDTAKMIAGTEQTIVDAQAKIDTSTRAAADAESLIAKNQAQMESLKTELQPLEKQSATAVSQVQLAQAKVDEANRMLAAAKQSAELLAKQVEAKKTQLASVTQTSAAAGETLAKSKAAAAEAAKQLESAKATLTKQRESLAAVEKEVEKKQADAAEREQALVTAQKTRDRASANLPEHQETLRQRNNHLADLKHHHANLVDRQNQSPAISSIALSDDEASLAVVDVEGGVRTFQLTDATPLERFQLSDATGSNVFADAYFLDQHQLVVHRHSGPPLTIDSRQRWVLERTIGGLESDLISDRVTSLDFRGDGQSIAIGSGTPSRQGQVLIVATSNGDVLRQFDDLHSDSVLCVRFSPDGRLLATASADKTIRLLDVQTEEVVGALDGHTHHVLSVAWKRDGRLIASGSADGTIKTWDVETGQQKRTIGGFPDEVTAVEFLGDSTRVASSCADGQLRIHETNNGGSVAAAAAPGDFLFTLGISADASGVFATGQTGTVHVWQTEGLKPAGQW